MLFQDWQQRRKSRDCRRCILSEIGSVIILLRGSAQGMDILIYIVDIRQKSDMNIVSASISHVIRQEKLNALESELQLLRATENNELDNINWEKGEFATTDARKETY